MFPTIKYNISHTLYLYLNNINIPIKKNCIFTLKYYTYFLNSV